MVSFFTAGNWEKDTIFGAARKIFGPSYFVTALLSIGLAWQKISSDVPVKAEPAGAEASFHSFGGFCGEKEHIPLLKKNDWHFIGIFSYFLMI